MALHVGVDAGTLLSAHIVKMGEETCGVDALIGAEAEPIEFALTESRKVERRLAERLGGESSCIRRSTTGKWFPLDECDFLSKISRLRSPFLAGWSGANDNEVVVHSSSDANAHLLVDKFFLKTWKKNFDPCCRKGRWKISLSASLKKCAKKLSPPTGR